MERWLSSLLEHLACHTVRNIAKIAYIVLGTALVIFILMGKYVPEIKEQHDIDACMDSGKVYDPVQKICRDDCWKWDDELGCLKE